MRCDDCGCVIPEGQEYRWDSEYTGDDVVLCQKCKNGDAQARREDADAQAYREAEGDYEDWDPEPKEFE